MSGILRAVIPFACIDALRHPFLTIVSQRQPNADKYEDSSDAAIEPLFEGVAGREPDADARRRPGDEQIPYRAVEIEDDTQEQERQRLRRGIRQNKLRQKRQKKQRYLGVQDICEKALEEDAPHRGRPTARGNWHRLNRALERYQ